MTDKFDRFVLSFDPRPSSKYPHGYWYACSSNDDYDADGSTPINALAGLITELDVALQAYKEASNPNDA